MNLRDLQFLISVYDAKSFSGAAKQLHTTQSNVSQCILRLEKKLEGPLFVRMYRSIVPTAKGERAYRYAKGVLACTGAVEDAIRDDLDLPHCAGRCATGRRRA